MSEIKETPRYVVGSPNCEHCRDTVVEMVRALFRNGGEVEPGGNRVVKSICSTCGLNLLLMADRHEST